MIIYQSAFLLTCAGHASPETRNFAKQTDETALQESVVLKQEIIKNMNVYSKYNI